jgi:uncharacterized protein YjiK
VIEDSKATPVLAETDAVEDLKRQQKEARRAAAQARALDPWERYRTLVDTLEEAMDLVELADRKARFALVIMGALNIAFFVMVTRSEFIDALPLVLRPFLGFYLLTYACVALFFFLEAIEALRPRRYRPHLPYPGDAGPDHFPEGLRYYEDVVLRDLDAYRRAWREVRFGQLNAELAVQNHVMARINSDKYRSLRRLYGGLRVLAMLAGVLLAVLALSMLLSRHPPYGAGASPALSNEAFGATTVRASAARTSSLGAPQAIGGLGLREASGIAWHPRRGSFFAVGDRGTLAEIDPSGKLLAEHHVKGNLEDVAVHEPSGRLVLLSEKKGELSVWDPASAAEVGRFALDVRAVLDREPADRNQGFEGITFRADPDQPGGGTFYLVHQRKPARLVALAFDPSGEPRTIGAADVTGRHGLKSYEDLTAVSWSETLGRLLVIAESDDTLLLVSPAGTITGTMALPGQRQEGLALDPDGALWVADDRAGLFKIPGALPTIAAAARP